MSTFCDRLVEERKRLGLNQVKFAALGGVTKHTQINYESGLRNPDSLYLSAIAGHGVDVGYLLTGVRAPVSVIDTLVKGPTVSQKVEDPIVRELTREQAALLDNYENADEEGRDAARRVLVALSKSKASKKAA